MNDLKFAIRRLLKNPGFTAVGHNVGVRLPARPYTNAPARRAALRDPMTVLKEG